MSSEYNAWSQGDESGDESPDHRESSDHEETPNPRDEHAPEIELAAHMVFPCGVSCCGYGNSICCTSCDDGTCEHPKPCINSKNWRYSSIQTSQDEKRNRWVRLVAVWNETETLKHLLAVKQDFKDVKIESCLSEDGEETLVKRSFMVPEALLISHSGALEAIVASQLSLDGKTEDGTPPTIEVVAPHDVVNYFVDMITSPRMMSEVDWEFMIYSHFFEDLVEFLDKYECTAILKLFEDTLRILRPTTRLIRLAIRYGLLRTLKAWSSDILAALSSGSCDSDYMDIMQQNLKFSKGAEYSFKRLEIEEFPHEIIVHLFKEMLLQYSPNTTLPVVNNGGFRRYRIPVTDGMPIARARNMHYNARP